MKKVSGHNAKVHSKGSFRVVAGRRTAAQPVINNLFNIPIDFFELLDEIAIGVAVLSMDRKIVFMNQTLKALTGAIENKPGRFQQAHNGTLYLTEIGDLPLSLQVKLLTFLDDKEIFPLGSVKGSIANVRIIAATHRNLEQRVNDNRFRKDLLFRLNVIWLHLPPLRDRQGDIQLLLDHF